MSMSSEQPVACQELDLRPWMRLLGFGGPACLIMVPLDPDGRSVAGLPAEAAARQFLSPAEQQQLQIFSFPRRRLQWLGGRVAVKLAARKLIGAGAQSSLSFQTMQVAAEASGRPYLQWSDAAPDFRADLPDISISHSGPLACALAVEQPARCGVDIQMITESTIRVREKFAATSELEILETLAGTEALPARLTLLWAAKEAIRKAAGTEPLPGFLEMHLSNAACNSPVQGRQGFLLTLHCPAGPRAAAMPQAQGLGPVDVATLLLEDAALAFTILGGHVGHV